MHPYVSSCPQISSWAIHGNEKGLHHWANNYHDSGNWSPTIKRFKYQCLLSWRWLVCALFPPLSVQLALSLMPKIRWICQKCNGSFTTNLHKINKVRWPQMIQNSQDWFHCLFFRHIVRQSFSQSCLESPTPLFDANNASECSVFCCKWFIIRHIRPVDGNVRLSMFSFVHTRE